MSGRFWLLIMLLLMGKTWAQPVNVLPFHPRHRPLIQEEQISRRWRVVSLRVPNEVLAEPINRSGEVVGPSRRFRIHAVDQHSLEQLHHHQLITISSNDGRGRGSSNMPIVIEFNQGTHLTKLRALLLPQD